MVKRKQYRQFSRGFDYPSLDKASYSLLQYDDVADRKFVDISGKLSSVFWHLISRVKRNLDVWDE